MWLLVNSVVVAAQARRPGSIVFILSDDLGFGDTTLSEPVDGQFQIPTPNIQRIADSGMIFRRGYSGQVGHQHGT